MRRFNRVLTTLLLVILVMSFAVREKWIASAFFLAVLVTWRIVFLPRCERWIRARSARS